MSTMKNKVCHIISLLLLMMLYLPACGSTPEATSPKEPSEIYALAKEEIKEGNTFAGIQLMSEIPDYKDAGLYVFGYSNLEYYLGEWEASLEEEFEKGTTVFPYEMKITVSDKNIWFDSEINGCYRLRFPISVESTLWRNNRTEHEINDYEGYLLFEIQDGKGVPADCILFGLEQGGLWFNFYDSTADRAKCSFSVTDSEGNVDTSANNTFYCERITERQETALRTAKEDRE